MKWQNNIWREIKVSSCYKMVNLQLTNKKVVKEGLWKAFLVIHSRTREGSTRWNFDSNWYLKYTLNLKAWYIALIFSILIESESTNHRVYKQQNLGKITYIDFFFKVWEVAIFPKDGKFRTLQHSFWTSYPTVKFCYVDIQPKTGKIRIIISWLYLSSIW